MKKIHEFLSRPVVTVLLFALAIGLLAGSGIGGARAALNEQSEIYKSTVKLPRIGVQLLENGKAKGELLTGLLAQSNNKLLPGKQYDEVLSVVNSGEIDEFVRVTVQKYWADENGNKLPLLDSELIDLKFVTVTDDSDSKWIVDDKASTDERTVLYCTSVLTPGEESGPFLKKISVNGEIIRLASQKREPAEGVPATITTTYVYNGCQLCLKATVDAVQTHNAQEAIKSAWGRTVTVSGDTLSLG